MSKTILQKKHFPKTRTSRITSRLFWYGGTTEAAPMIYIMSHNKPGGGMTWVTNYDKYIQEA